MVTRVGRKFINYCCNKWVWLAFAIGFINCPVLAQTAKAQPLTAINSEYDELMPQLSTDGKTIYFVRSAHPQNIGGETAGQDIWVSRQASKNAWQEPGNIGEPLNNAFHNAVTGVSPDGTLWLTNIYINKKKMAPGLSYAIKSGGRVGQTTTHCH